MGSTPLERQRQGQGETQPPTPTAHNKVHSTSIHPSTALSPPPQARPPPTPVHTRRQHHVRPQVICQHQRIQVRIHLVEQALAGGVAQHHRYLGVRAVLLGPVVHIVVRRRLVRPDAAGAQIRVAHQVRAPVEVCRARQGLAGAAWPAGARPHGGRRHGLLLLRSAADLDGLLLLSPAPKDSPSSTGG